MPKEIKTTIRFNSKEERDNWREHAKNKYDMTFSEYVRMLVSEDMSEGEKPQEIQKYENEVITTLQAENEKLRTLVYLNQEKIIEKIEFLFQTYLLRQQKTLLPGDAELAEKIMNLLNAFDYQGRPRHFSLSEIASTLNVNDADAIKCLDTLIEEKKVAMNQGMKYRRVKVD